MAQEGWICPRCGAKVVLLMSLCQKEINSIDMINNDNQRIILLCNKPFFIR